MPTSPARPTAKAAASDDGRTLREMPENTHPGWTRLQWVAPDGHYLQTQFRGPGGEIISGFAYRKRLRSGEIPTIDRATGEVSAPPPPRPTHPSAATAQTPDEPPTLGPLDLPAPEPDRARAAPGQATAAELSLTAQIVLIIATSLIALLTSTPELAMSDIEAQGISVPLANIFARSELNRRFGRYLAGSSDYTLLGYALYAYGYRVIGQVGARAQAEQAAQGTQRGFPHAVPQTPRPQPAYAPAVGGADEPGGQPGSAGERTAPASGGIGGAVNGAFTTAASRIVGYHPIQNSGAG